MAGLHKLLEPETAIGATHGRGRRRRGRGRRRSRPLGAGRELRRRAGSTRSRSTPARPTTATRSSAGPIRRRHAARCSCSPIPYSFPVGDFLAVCNERLPGVTLLGGMASAGMRPGTNRLALDDRVDALGRRRALVLRRRSAPGGGVPGLSPDRYAVHGDRARNATSCTSSPGNPRWRVCRRSCRPRASPTASSCATDCISASSSTSTGSTSPRGDFLVRNVLGADRRNGAIAIGDRVEVGTTVQFQVRDAESADDDLRALLRGVNGEAALMFTCNGRGRHLFAEPSHDAGRDRGADGSGCRWPAGSARARSARSAAATSCTLSRPVSPSSNADLAVVERECSRVRTLIDDPGWFVGTPRLRSGEREGPTWLTSWSSAGST